MRATVASPQRLVLAFALIVVVFGLFVEWVAFGWWQPGLWVPDLVVGLAFLAAGVRAFRPSRAIGVLSLLTALAWFLGTLIPCGVYWHRGPLVHLLVTYPGWRPRRLVSGAAVIIGYLAASVTVVWSKEQLAIGLSCLLLVAVPILDRRDVRSMVPSVALAIVLGGGSLARLMIHAGTVSTAALLAYETVLCAIAIGIAVAPPPSTTVADLIVELSGTSSDTLRDSLARALGDPGLRVGFWAPTVGGYVDVTGVEVRGRSGRRTTTVVHGDQEPLAVIVHDALVVLDAGIVDAVRAATRLTGANARLHAEVRAQVAELAASRRRLLAAGDDERQRLERQLHDGPQRRLRQLLYELRLPIAVPAPREPLRQARLQLEATLRLLDDLAHGLHPRELSGGLAQGLAALADRSRISVQITAPTDRYPSEVELAVHFLCMEALTNTAKHAGTATATIEVVRQAGALAVTITDDGRGGADPTRGTGLRGLIDRIEAIGGRLWIGSALGSAGTRLHAVIPVDDEPPR